MPHRVFDLPHTTRAEPVSFTLGADTYQCLDDLPAQAVYLLTDRQGATRAQIGFIRSALVTDDEERFVEQLASKGQGGVVTQPVLSDVVDYLIEAYADRPTLPPENSPGGRQATTDSSPLDSVVPA